MSKRDDVKKNSFMSINSQNLSRVPKKSFFSANDDFNNLYEIEERVKDEQKKSSSNIKKSSSECKKSSSDLKKDDSYKSNINLNQKKSNLQSKLSNKPK